jgi:hypothetical protein
MNPPTPSLPFGHQATDEQIEVQRERTQQRQATSEQLAGDADWSSADRADDPIAEPDSSQ